MLSNLTTGLSQDDSSNNTMALLRRIVHLLESSGMVDSGTRQRVTVDAMTGGLTLSNISTVGTLGAVTTVSTVSNLAAIANDTRPLLDLARIAYNTGLRAKLN